MRIIQTLLAAVLLAGLSISSTARAEKFAYPYHVPDLDWYTIETEHFEIHYPVSKVSREDGNEHYINAEYSARKTAKVSEEMWPLMCGQLNYFLKEKIHVVVLDQMDYLTGFTIPSWDWIEISANPGSNFYRARGRGEWFSDVMIHEFAHVVSLKASNALADGVQGINFGGLYSDGIRDTATGVQLSIGQNDPWWWTEGGAEFWSDNTGYYVWTSRRDAFIRQTVLDDRLLTYDEWVTRVDASGFGEGERGYQQGYSMALYLRERFGDDTMARFAIEYGKGWRPNWETVIQDVLGITGRELYEDWKAYITAKYEKQRDDIIAEGLVEGYPIQGVGEWHFGDRDAEDAWWGKALDDRERTKGTHGSYSLYPKISDDGRWVGINTRGSLGLQQASEGSIFGFGGGNTDAQAAQGEADSAGSISMGFMSGWDFVPGQDAVVVTATEDSYAPNRVSYWTQIRLERDGYNWNQLFYVPLEMDEHKERGRALESLTSKTVMGRQTKPLHPVAIPNTQRGTDPAVRDDGRVVYLEYFDGTTNVVTINLDGTDKKSLTTFHDGTMFQRPDWSPDGTQVVVSMYRNYQNDIILLDAETGEVTPITWDSAESFDPHWGHDGRIYFTSDPDFVMNVYSYDPETKQILKITNVIGDAETPYLTPEGNLLFTYKTAYGYQSWALPKEQFLNADYSDQFITEPDMAEVTAVLEYREDLSIYEGMTRKYRATRSMVAPLAIPTFRVSNDTMTNWGVTGGVLVRLSDVVEDHVVLFAGELGEDSNVWGYYENHVRRPTVGVFARTGLTKFDFARAVDQDNDPATPNDVDIFEGKQNQVYTVVQGFARYPWDPRGRFQTGVSVLGITYGFKTTSDVKPEPFMATGALSGFAQWSTVSQRYYWGGHPVGRIISLAFLRGYTDIIYEPYYGVDVDDGQQLDKYQYNRIDFRWTEHWRVKAPWDKDVLGLLGQANKYRHIITADVQLGYIDRNAQYNDEYRAGGRHPYYWGSGNLAPNTMFSGYPSSSLVGETMLVASLAYKFPVKTDMNKKVGPFYFYDLHAQLMGTVGNLWSYRPPDEPGSYYTNRFDARVAYDESDVVREVPFQDYSYKNSPVDPVTGKVDPNYLLSDIGAELRLSTVMFNRGSWNSFLRVSYGLNEIRGISDVNGDDITSTADNGVGDNLSTETEKPGVRVYIGLGTGW